MVIGNEIDSESKEEVVRFCDFFLEYQLEVLGISHYIKLKDIKKYKLVGVFSAVILMILGSVCYFFVDKHIGGVMYSLSVVVVLITTVLAEKKKEKRYMLDQHYKPYSKRRMECLANL